MPTSRRTFLKSAIAGASIAIGGVPGEAHPLAFAHSHEITAPAQVNVPAVAPPMTRGVGIYPGDPREYTGPELAPDETTYRNLALRRAAYHSSAYDYNLTAQLATDGIRETRMPRWVATVTSAHGTLKRNEREWVLDHNPVTAVELKGTSVWIVIEMGGGDGPLEIDRADITVLPRRAGIQASELTFVLSGSDDGQTWKELGRTTNPTAADVSSLPAGFARPGELFIPSIHLDAPAAHYFYRVDFKASSEETRWQACEIAFFNQQKRVEVAGPHHFSSAWMSAGSGEEWIYVDLGANAHLDRVVLYWIARATEGSIQVSPDAVDWQDVAALPATGTVDEIKLPEAREGRYVRVLMKRAASPLGYILSELEIYGKGGRIVKPQVQPDAGPDGRIDLRGGGWRIERDSQVDASGGDVSRPGYDAGKWLVATVPGTVLTSFHNAGAIADPNFGDYQNMVSDSFFYADFWYRNEFVAPAYSADKHVWLNLDGVNWKADVWLNGESLGHIDGGFMRGRFEVTKLLKAGRANALAIRVLKNATPGSIKEKTFDNPDKNGGALGADNPTYHASIGWDWIPTIRGRNTGLWNDVYLSASGPVTVDDPYVSATLPLPHTSTADLRIEVSLNNHEPHAVSGTLRGRFGDVTFEKAITLETASTNRLVLDPSTNPELRLSNPMLWWPVGYGEPNLYPVEIAFEAGGKTSDVKRFQAGVRQMTYHDDGGSLRIFINGRRLVPRGGNWGFGESMLRYRAREYDAAVRYHRDMNFTMIRNWVGQIGDNEFYEACDRHGVMVWQDFWLANPWDGPDPDNNAMFLANVRDTVRRIRHHASIGLYVGRNEGYPPPPLESGIRQILAEEHPGIHYIPSSADDTVSGHGPYMAMPQKFYFTARATTKLHSELGMPNIVTMDSLREMMPEADMWPQGRLWGMHDFSLNGAQGGASFRTQIDQSYGGAANAAEWVELAQFVNYAGYRAMFEAQSQHRMGLLIWMSHPCWPTFVWQTYDYYFEPTAAYFGCKKASEPLHIQWNQASDQVEVVNYNAGAARNLTAHAEILNLDGSMKWEKSATVDSADDSVQSPIALDFPAGLTPVHFIRLKLNRGDDLVSENFYWRALDRVATSSTQAPPPAPPNNRWRGLAEGDFHALRTLSKVKLQASTRRERKGDRWQLSTQIENSTATPALMIRLKPVRETSGDRILPALFSDNYVALMPGETRTIVTDLSAADARGENPRIVVSGFNVGEVNEG